MPKTAPPALLLLSLALLQGCAVPKTVSFYDEECKVVAKRMVLDVDTKNAAANCKDKDCIGEAVGSALVLATSTVISGSIVVAGNVAYWLEKKRNCDASRSVPEKDVLGQKPQ